MFFCRPLCFLPVLLISLVVVSSAQSPDGYRKAPAPMDRILSVGPTPGVSFSPDRKWMLLEQVAAMPAIGEVAAPSLRLAGLNINPLTGGPHAPRGSVTLELAPTTDGAPRAIPLPDGALVLDTQWSPKSDHLALAVQVNNALELWVMNISDARPRKLLDGHLSAALGAGAAFSWAADGTQLLALIIPRDRGAMPERPSAPAGPIVQEADGQPKPTWTSPTTLKDAHDEVLFEYFLRSQPVLLDLNCHMHVAGAPDNHVSAALSPDGKYILVSKVHRPYSYRVDMSLFPRRTQILDRSGQVVADVADTPLQEIPLGANWAFNGPRGFAWYPLANAQLVYAEALDGGDPSRKVEHRDQIVSWVAPFTEERRVHFKTEWRIGGGRGGILTPLRVDMAFVTESWNPSKRTRRHLITLGTDPRNNRVVWERSSQDRYNDAGEPVMSVNSQGTVSALLAADGQSIYLSGAGASPEGDRPFLDRFHLSTFATDRLFQSEAPYYESVAALMDAGAATLVTRRESIDETPNFYRLERVTGKRQALTRFPDPAPEFSGLKPEVLTYERKDGVKLSAKLYLPKGYKPADGPLPFVFWAYPLEFKDAAAASQMRGSPYRFVRPSLMSPDHMYLLTQGYGILDDPAMPIIGEGDAQPNDTYIEQLVASAEAAVEKVVALGVADRHRIAVGGHSYGAFMTANLLAHSDLFRTGIARSGAYNRTLTPFGFQGETRNFWEATETYSVMSPFFAAKQINEPILLIHGERDANPGTFPIQTDRLFGALKGLGGIARYVVLPGEDHGYRARESVEHTLWEMTTWLDRHVKNAAPALTRTGVKSREPSEKPAALIQTEKDLRSPQVATLERVVASPTPKPSVASDPTKRRALERRVDILRAKLSQTISDGEANMSAVEASITQAEGELQLAKSKREHFAKVEIPNRIAQAELELRGAKDRAKEAEEELKQIELMYKEQDLQDLTAEFVIARGRRQAERSAESVRIQEVNLGALRRFELPRQEALLELELAAKKRALEKARREVASTARQHKIAVMSAEAELATAEEELAVLKAVEGK